MVLAVLFIVLLVLKLAGVLALSWLWVTSPLWLGVPLMLTLVSITFLTVGKAITNKATEAFSRMMAAKMQSDMGELDDLLKEMQGSPA